MCRDFYSNTHQVVPINRIESNISLTRKNNLHMISRTQFPLMLAYTCTIHKVQGLTIPSTVVVLDLKLWSIICCIKSCKILARPYNQRKFEKIICQSSSKFN